MSRVPLAVALLPGPGDADATRASVRAEAGPNVAIAELRDGGGAELLDAAETIAFARAGDRWRAGTLAPRLRTLAAHPTAPLSVAAHLLVDAGGEPVLTIPPPSLPLDPAELLLRARVEPSAVLVRADALDAAALALLLRPHGEVVVWNRLARAGLVRTSEVAAEIPVDAERHGTNHEARTAALWAAATDATTAPDASGASSVRRELLRRLYLDAGTDPQPAGLIELLAGAAADPGTTAVVEDLQWALERARDALAAERVTWPEGVERAASDAPGPHVEEELFDLRAAVRTMTAEVEVRDALARRYEAEILRRDEIIARMGGASAGGAA